MIEIPYTLCFLKRDNQVLMLKRNYPPNQGLWNGVGGHIKPDETPTECILREINEETGYFVNTVNFCGLLTWEGFEIPKGGLYIFSASAPDNEPNLCDEGLLEWKTRDWVLHSPEVVSNIHYFGPYVLKDNIAPQAYHFIYDKGKIMDHRINPLPDWVDIVNC